MAASPSFAGRALAPLPPRAAEGHRLCSRLSRPPRGGPLTLTADRSGLARSGQRRVLGAGFWRSAAGGAAAAAGRAGPSLLLGGRALCLRGGPPPLLGKARPDLSYLPAYRFHPADAAPMAGWLEPRGFLDTLWLLGNSEGAGAVRPWTTTAMCTCVTNHGSGGKGFVPGLRQHDITASSGKPPAPQGTVLCTHATARARASSPAAAAPFRKRRGRGGAQAATAASFCKRGPRMYPLARGCRQFEACRPCTALCGPRPGV